MEQLSSMLTRLKRGIGAGDSSQPPLKQPLPADTGNNSGNSSMLEDDGFLLISESECETAAVYASTMDRCAVQGHASTYEYNQVSGQYADGGGRGFTMFATCNPTPVSPTASADEQNESYSISRHPVICDVPFQLNPKLQEKDRLQGALAQLDLETTQFDWQKYYYDFDFEHSSLRELCSMGDSTVQMDYSGVRSSIWER